MFVAWWLGCSDPSYPVEGTVVEVLGPHRIVVDHEDVPGLMPAMVMPFEVAPGLVGDDVKPGARIAATYSLSEGGSRITALKVTGQGPAPVAVDGPAPLRVGQTLGAFTVVGHDGGGVVLGPDQTERVALTFVYTRCPLPEACPAIVARLQALQQALGDADGVRILAVTLDPDFDTAPVLAEYAARSGAGPRWTMGRADELEDLAMAAGLSVVRTADGTVVHGVRLVVLDRGGVMIERYDDARFPLDRVVQQLTTGGPPMPPGNSGTITSEEQP